MADDAQLLRSYVEARSEPAFAELVQRHVGLVYHAALRQLGSEKHLAEDVVQGVFILLAEKSPGLLAHPSLAGWLHTATHFKVAHALRAERRRLAREDAALAMNELAHETAAAEWERIRPVLDQVLLELNPSDREAVLLRFFENRPFAEIGARLRLTETAAHKRVERALEKLRERLARRGVTSTAALLTGLLTAQNALATPAGLATSVTGAVVASGLPVAATVSGVAFMSTKTTVGIAAVAVLLLGGVASYEVHAERGALDALAVAERDTAALQSQLRDEEARLARERAARVVIAPAAAPAPVARAPGFVGPTPEERTAEGRAFLKAHPEVRAAYVTYLDRTLRAENADLIAAMKLSPEETDKFIALKMDAIRSFVGQHLFTTLEQDWPQGEYGRRLKELLGPERLQILREDERSTPARSLMDDLTRALYYTPTPLAPAQRAPFQRMVQDVLSDRTLGPRDSGPMTFQSPSVWDEVMKRAPGVLSPPQLEALADARQKAVFEAAFAAARRVYDAP